MQRSCFLAGAFALLLTLAQLSAAAATATPVHGSGLQPLDADALSAVSAGGLPDAAQMQLGLQTRSGGATLPSAGDLTALALQQQVAALERQQALAQLRDGATASVRVATQLLWRVGTDTVVVPLAPLLLPLFPLPLPVLPPPPKKH